MMPSFHFHSAQKARLLAGTALALTLLALAACVEVTPDGQRVGFDPGAPVMLVNGEAIRQGELDSEVNRIVGTEFTEADSSQIHNYMPQIRKIAMDNLVNAALIRQQIAKRNVKVTDQDIDHDLDMMRQFWVLRNSTLEEQLAAAGVKMDQFRQRVGRQLAADKLEETVLDLKRPSDAKVEAYYKSNPDRFTWTRAVHLQIILIAYPNGRALTAEDRIQTDQKAQEAYQRLATGEPFDRIAAQYSNSPSARNDGDIGWIDEKSDLPTSVVNAAFNLEAGKIGRIITTPTGCYIVKALEKRDRRVAPLDEVHAIIANNLWLEELKQGYDEFINKLRVDAKIERPNIKPVGVLPTIEQIGPDGQPITSTTQSTPSQ